MKKNKAVIVLCIGLVVLILGSILAQAFHTGFYSVKVSRVSFDTERGTLSGLLYMPKDASAQNPKPTLITTHGYLNSAEMQDAPAVEMSRRGYVVLALDMYDHGHSKGNAENTGAFFSFWPRAMHDAVQYMYDQPYVLKDGQGNGVIAVSGHSMGGFSTNMALFFDEAETYAATGIRKIMAGLSVGADYSWCSYLGVSEGVAAPLFGPRTVGKIAAHYDEFFFDSAATASGKTVVRKDYAQTVEGQTFLGQVTLDEEGNPSVTPGVTDGTWYNVDGGKRIIFEPNQIHPWNHFSKGTTAMMVQFYDVAFADYASSLKSIAPNSQVWMLKELFELVAMVGFFMVIVSITLLLAKVPFFNKVVTDRPAPLAGASTLRGKMGAVVLFFATMIIPSMIYTAGSGEANNWLKQIAIVAVGLGVVGLIFTLVTRDENKKGWIGGSIVVILAGICMRYMTTKGIPNNKVFQGPTVSTIVTWAILCACIAAIIMVCVYLFGNKKAQGASLGTYGIAGNVVTVIAALVLAIVVAVIAFALVFIVDAIFKTDFRIWTFAFKSFEMSAIPAALKYMPLFLIYYLVAGMACVNNTSTEKLQGGWGYVLAALTNMGGILLWIIVQYGKLFATGSAFYPGEALSGILLQALIPTLALASILTKFLYKKFGNIWVPAFMNTIIVTMMTVANTTIYFQA